MTDPNRQPMNTVTRTAMNDAQAAAEIFHEAARLNREDPLRSGSMLHFPDYGQVVMTGDIHGHERNFNKLMKYADLQHARARHVILHELIHADPMVSLGEDTSHLLMLTAARWRIDFPDQIHFLQSNHELAQLTGKEICKAGRVVTHDFQRALVSTYGAKSDDVLQAIHDFIESFALAARTSNRIFLSHSLPNVRDLSTFDPEVVNRSLLHADFREGGDAYVMVWGRHQTPDLLTKLAQAFDVDWFVCGHQPQEAGYEVAYDRMIILASDHNHGVFLPFDLKRKHSLEGLVGLIRSFAAIA